MSVWVRVLVLEVVEEKVWKSDDGPIFGFAFERPNSALVKCQFLNPQVVLLKLAASFRK